MKLVRDSVPEIILKSGRTPIFYIAATSQYKKLLRNKLIEEVEEFLQNESVEEIVDILEVLEAICKNKSYKLKDILKLKIQKKNINGGFDKKIVLDKII